MTKHINFYVPDDYSNDQKGDFFESFVSELLRPMRFTVTQRLRFTGMEIDLLARGEDQPRTIVVECKAHKDSLPADVITKLIGNVGVRKAEAGWLFTTCDLTKDGRGLWEDIQNDVELARKFTWFNPERLIDVLIQQRTVIEPSKLEHLFSETEIGDWTLIISPTQRTWMVQLIDSGVPRSFSAFQAENGSPLSLNDGKNLSSLMPRLSALDYKVIQTNPPTRQGRLSLSLNPKRAAVARVISGDSWDDLRPARPADFAGRDDVISDIANFIEQVRISSTSTRTFAIQAPSGWGKSSLILKLGDLARNGKRIPRCSLTAVDTRSATNSAFVTESLRFAFQDAAKSGLIDPNNPLKIDSLNEPIESSDLQSALEQVAQNQSTIVLIFDQFEELFAKEDLFETFNAVRELSLEIDSKQVPLILGFAWKTDISLPQQHPAYYMWHSLEARRRSFKVRAFGVKDISKVITLAEKSSERKLQRVLRARLLDQCQGLPWLLKKLLVHIVQRVNTVDSQFALLERELDVELLFKEDLSQLSNEELLCLKYVASHSPVPVAEVEDRFQPAVTNSLINSHLLVRSGMNYVVYWDIFRDYLVEGKIPSIPWARTFQRSPGAALRALSVISELGKVNYASLSEAMGLSEKSTINILSDLISVQLVELTDNGNYKIAGHIADLDPLTIAEHVQGQLKRHIIVRELVEKWERGVAMSSVDWNKHFAAAHPRTSSFSANTVSAYANSFRDWLLFSGLLEKRQSQYVRPTNVGLQLGISLPGKLSAGTFLGTASPDALVRLITKLKTLNEPVLKSSLEQDRLRNATVDAVMLGIATVGKGGYVKLTNPNLDLEKTMELAKALVLEQSTIAIVSEAVSNEVNDPVEIGMRVAASMEASWQRTSALRYGTGLRRYYRWAMGHVKGGKRKSSQIDSK